MAATNNRRTREQQFVSGDANGSTLSVDLLESAFTLLRASLRDRRDLWYVTPNNHFSPNATGVVVMTVTALDAWMNENLARLLWLHEDQRSLGLKSLPEKYVRLVHHFGSTPTMEEDLRLLCDARNEMVHFLPRSLGAFDAVPPWLAPLRSRGLLLERKPPGNSLPDKLCSYRLAYWAWGTVAAVAGDVVATSGGARSQIVGMLAGNFDWYKGVCSPDELAAYDERYKIRPTPEID